MISQQHRSISAGFSVISRANWVRLNRVLAWAMIVTPVLQFFIHAPWQNCLMLDVGLLMAHGVLSLVLFGIPKLKHKKFVFTMHMLGWYPDNISPRNSFLLSAYRIGLGLCASLLVFISGNNCLLLALVFPIAGMPFATLRHMVEAIAQALKRHAWKNPDAVALVIVALYVCLFIHNLIFR